MGPMPKKKSLTLQRVLVLLLAYIMLAVCGGVAASVLFVPGVIGANKAAKAVIPSLKVENVDFDVTSLPQKSTMYARDGSTVIATFYNQNRIVVPLKKISKTMQQAVVAREDRRFWTHAGVDVQGVMRAFVQTYLVKGSQQGGSSLTQQYVKNVLLMQAIEDDDSIAQYHATEDTIARKIREMLISVQMEKKYSKAEILQGYLNIAQFGNNLYGVETAAQRYFSVSAADLNVVQSATIAAITKNPSLYDPLVEENQKESENQRNIVLKLMLQEGYITQKQYTEAVNTPLKDTLKAQDVNVGCQDTGDYAYFCDFVVHRIQNSEEFGKTRAERNKLLQEGGLKIVTTLDVEANSTMMETARNTIPPDDPSGMEIAMAAVKPGTGEVLSFGLNRYYDATPAAANDPTKTSQNYAVDLADGGGSGWTIGSSWKPINLIAWMEAGHSINDNLQTSTSYPTTDFACSNYSGGADSWNVSNAMGAGTVNPESPFLGLVRSHNTTQASMGAILKLCKVANAHFLSSVPGPRQVLPGGDLDVCVVAPDQLHRTARQLEQAAIIGDEAGAGLVQFIQRRQIGGPVEALGRLHRIKGAAVGGVLHHAAFRHSLAVAALRPLDGVLHRHRRGGGTAAGSGRYRIGDNTLLLYFESILSISTKAFSIDCLAIFSSFEKIEILKKVPNANLSSSTLFAFFSQPKSNKKSKKSRKIFLLLLIY